MTNTTGSANSQLWMGGLEHYMNENFIMNAFHKHNEKPTAVKVMRNKYTGDPAGYGFVHFSSEEESKRVMQKLNGKTISSSSHSSMPVRFRLNMSYNFSQKNSQSDREFSLWIGDLSPDVDDYTLHRTFASRYQSIVSATVILDGLGLSKCYGFIRFTNEDEQKHCLTHMNGFKGLGLKSIRVSNVVPKSHRMSVNTSCGYSSSQDYSTGDSKPEKSFGIRSTNIESSYWQNYLAWQQCDDTNTNLSHKIPSDVLFPQAMEPTAAHGDDLDLIEHNTKLDIESSNRELIQRDFNLWDALECSKWTPVECYD